MTETTLSGLKAVVLGATGATGRELVKQLLENPKWSQVVAVGRRSADIADKASESKLRNVIVDMDKLQEEAQSEFLGADSVFCALGTTRAAAKSADAFRKVDFEYVNAAAQTAHAAGVPHFALVSAQGASAKIPANDWKLFHGLLYSKTKGLAEQAVIDQTFSYVTIMRPGMLDRGSTERPLEKIALAVLSSVPVSKVASVMIHDAERYHSSPGQVQGVKYFSMGEIQKYPES